MFASSTFDGAHNVKVKAPLQICLETQVEFRLGERWSRMILFYCLIPTPIFPITMVHEKLNTHELQTICRIIFLSQQGATLSPKILFYYYLSCGFYIKPYVRCTSHLKGNTNFGLKLILNGFFCLLKIWVA